MLSLAEDGLGCPLGTHDGHLSCGLSSGLTVADGEPRRMASEKNLVMVQPAH